MKASLAETADFRMSKFSLSKQLKDNFWPNWLCFVRSLFIPDHRAGKVLWYAKTVKGCQ